MTTIMWFRQDLRVADNPALAHAAKRGDVVPVYIHEEGTAARAPGGASKWFLHHSLADLGNTLGGLVIARGDPRELLPDLVKRCKATGVVWNRCYDPHAVKRDSALKATLTEQGIEVRSFNGSLLFEPWDVKTGAGGPFKVFTPFWRACLRMPVAAPVAAPDITCVFPVPGLGLDDLKLLPAKPNWASAFDMYWKPGEAGARVRAGEFFDGGLRDYAQMRDRPDLEGVSRLSAHLHFGDISPRQIYRAVQIRVGSDPSLARDGEKFLAEIGWREFSHHLIYHFPTLLTKNWKPAFDDYPWADDPTSLMAWQRGRTGYPFVDAGMRELWATGIMHNRVRMVAASFLTKHLRVDWRRGEAWFWDTLVDADLANNAAGWQWVAGSGADASPYFRIFNPTEQGRRFDPDGVYIKRWCPELARLPVEHVHAPWEAPASALATAGVVLGKTYPAPIVDHAAARAAALAGYQRIKGEG